MAKSKSSKKVGPTAAECLEDQRMRLFQVQGILKVAGGFIDSLDDDGSDQDLQAMRWTLVSAVEQLGCIADDLPTAEALRRQEAADA